MILLVEDYLRNISVKCCQDICSEIAVKSNFNANFYFSHYKSMTNVRWHSNHSSYPIETNITIIRSPGL